MSDMKKIFLVLGGLLSLTIAGARYVEIPISQFRREARSHNGGFPFKEMSEPLPKLSRALEDKEVIEQDSSEDPSFPIPPVKDSSEDPGFPIPPVKDSFEDPRIPIPPVKDSSENPGIPISPVKNYTEDPRIPVKDFTEDPGIVVPPVGALMLCAYFATQRYVPSFCQMMTESREERPGLENVCDYYITRGYMPFFCNKDKPPQARDQEGVKNLKGDAEVMESILQSFTYGGGLYPDIPERLQNTMEGDEAKKDILEFIERITGETSLSKNLQNNTADKVVEGALAAGTGIALLGSYLNQPKLQQNQNLGYSNQGYPGQDLPYQGYPLQSYPQLLMPPYMIPQYITIPILQYPQTQLPQNGNKKLLTTSTPNLPAGHNYYSLPTSSGSLNNFFPGRASEVKDEDSKTNNEVTDGNKQQFYPHLSTQSVQIMHGYPTPYYPTHGYPKPYYPSHGYPSPYYPSNGHPSPNSPTHFGQQAQFVVPGIHGLMTNKTAVAVPDNCDPQYAFTYKGHQHFMCKEHAQFMRANDALQRESTNRPKRDISSELNEETASINNSKQKISTQAKISVEEAKDIEEQSVGPDHLEWVPVSAPISSSSSITYYPSNLRELDIINPRDLESINGLYGCFPVLSHYIGNVPYYRCETDVPYGNINTAQPSSVKDSSKWVSING